MLAWEGEAARTNARNAEDFAVSVILAESIVHAPYGVGRVKFAANGVAKFEKCAERADALLRQVPMDYREIDLQHPFNIYI